MKDVVAIIPARYGSTRFPGKLLADIAGKSVLQHVYERVTQAELVSRIAVATDDERIAREVESFGGTFVMTSPDHKSGTDRVAEAARTTGGEIIVNVQGDEPLIDPAAIDSVVKKIIEDEGIVCSTAAYFTSDGDVYSNPNCVKAVFDNTGRALYFSRSPIPFYRDSGFNGAYIHIGIYCFRRSFLDIYATLLRTELEKVEMLEQLRILENGYGIGVAVTGKPSIGIDTPEDLETARRIFEKPDGS